MNQYFKNHPVDTKSIVQHLTCPLCEGLFRDAQTINQCNHTFCKSCILKYFYQNVQNTNCPVCRTHLGGRPQKTLVNDTFWQELTDQIFPEFKEIDFQAAQLMHSAFEKNQILLKKDQLIVDYEKREKDNTDQKSIPNQSQTICFNLIPWSVSNRKISEGDLKKGSEEAAPQVEAEEEKEKVETPKPKSEKKKKGGKKKGKQSEPKEQEKKIEVQQEKKQETKEIQKNSEQPLLLATKYVVDERVSIQAIRTLVFNNQRDQTPSGKQAVEIKEMSMIKLYCNNIELNENHSLGFIKKTIWCNMENKPIQIQYRRVAIEN